MSQHADMPTKNTQDKQVAVVTGASRGLGLALARALVERGWHVVCDGRDPARLAAAASSYGGPGSVTAVAGDVADPDHRRRLVAEAVAAGPVRLLVNNASILGPSPQPHLTDYPLDVLARVYAVNVSAPLSLVQHLATDLGRHHGVIVNVTSDAAVAAYEGWGGYGSAKAALDQLSAVLAVELPEVSVYAFDPGDMATDLHQQAFPGEDISDRPTPESVVPALLRLLDSDLPSGRYRTADLGAEHAA